jgi:mannose/cellobiose epimerase-like protein (N-acyl-D-glucosamine 2-epimerase family)
VACEGIVAAALLSLAVPAEAAFYLGWYEKMWAWSWVHLIDHERGAWYRLVAPDGSRYDDAKSPPGKVDYHSIGMCLDVARAFRGAAGGR